MKKFKKKFDYYVFRKKDVKSYLSKNLIRLVESSHTFINSMRTNNNLRPLKCVCIEETWPEYDIVWRMLENRFNKEHSDDEMFPEKQDEHDIDMFNINIILNDINTLLDTINISKYNVHHFKELNNKLNDIRQIVLQYI